MPLAHGSDGGGSIRIPASCCGLFGIKPSRGRVSPAPYVSGSLELSQNGPLSVSVRDAAAFLDVIAGYEPGDAHWAPPPARPFLEEVGADPGRLRIAFTTEPPIPHEVDPRVVAVARSAADALAALGHDVIEGRAAVVGRGAARRLREALAGRAGDVPARAISRCSSRSTARSPRRRTRRRASSSPGRSPRWSSPRAGSSRSGTTSTSCSRPASASCPCRSAGSSSPTIPWEQFRRGGEFTPFTPIVNVTGQPAAMVPFDVVDGLPVGVQLIGPPAGEAMLFRLAAQLEEAHPWARAAAQRIAALSSAASSTALVSVGRDRETGVVACERAEEQRMRTPVERPGDRRGRADLRLEHDDVLGRHGAAPELPEQRIERLARVGAALPVRQDVAQRPEGIAGLLEPELANVARDGRLGHDAARRRPGQSISSCCVPIRSRSTRLATSFWRSALVSWSSVCTGPAFPFTFRPASTRQISSTHGE